MQYPAMFDWVDCFGGQRSCFWLRCSWECIWDLRRTSPRRHFWLYWRKFSQHLHVEVHQIKASEAWVWGLGQQNECNDQSNETVKSFESLFYDLKDMMEQSSMFKWMRSKKLFCHSHIPRSRLRWEPMPQFIDNFFVHSEVLTLQTMICLKLLKLNKKGGNQKAGSIKKEQLFSKKYTWS